MATNVAEKKSTNVVAIDPSILLADVGAGQEQMTQDDLMIPRLQILQSMSPQVNKRDGAYVEGAEVGMILNTVTNKVYDGEDGILVVPVSYRRAHIEWKANRGGLAGDHGADTTCLASCTRGDRGEYFTADGNEIVPTAEYFVYVIEADGSYAPAILSMSKSQMKKARRWNSMINSLQIQHPTEDTTINPAMFYTAYRLTTVPEENDAGSWFGWGVTMEFDGASGGIIGNLPNGQAIYLSARDFRQQVSAGEVKVQPDSQDDVM